LSQAEYCDLRTEKALTAGNRERNHDPIALFERALRARFDNLSHELVTQDVSLHLAGDHSVVQMQIGAANRGRGDLDDRIACVRGFRVRGTVDANIVLAVPCECAHHVCGYFTLALAVLMVAPMLTELSAGRQDWHVFCLQPHFLAPIEDIPDPSATEAVRDANSLSTGDPHAHGQSVDQSNATIDIPARDEAGRLPGFAPNR
jgi:hypothetical protein